MSRYATFARYYDRLTRNVDYPKMARKIKEYLQKYRPNSELLLDLACGTGSLSVELSKIGFDVIGTDESCEMLSEAIGKNAGLERPVLFLNQGMQDLDLYGTVDAAVCTLDSVNHVTDEKILNDVFGKVSLFLEPDGVFIFDVNTPYKHEKILANETYVYDCEEVYCVWQNSTKNGVTQISLDFFEYEEGAYYRSSETFCEVAYSDETIVRLLENNKMTVCARFDDYTEKKVGTTTQRVVYVARKG